MHNLALVRAVRAAGSTYVAVARAAEVAPKTVSRWVASQASVPRQESRIAVAEFLGVQVQELWPTAGARAAGAEIVATYRRRADLPASLMTDLVAGTTEGIDIIGYDETQLWDVPGFLELLSRRAAEGVRVRIVLADPDGQAIIAAAEVAGADVEVGRTRARLAWLQVRTLSTISGVELLMHDTAVAMSAVHVDEHLVVCPLLPGGSSPALYLQGDGPLLRSYAEACQEVSVRALAYQPEQRAGARRRSLAPVRAALQ